MKQESQSMIRKSDMNISEKKERRCLDCNVIVPEPTISRYQFTHEQSREAANAWDFPRCPPCRMNKIFKEACLLPRPYKIQKQRPKRIIT